MSFKVLVHHFLRLCLLCIVKKFWLYSNKTDGGDRFWSLPLWQFRQSHYCRSTTLGRIFWLNRRRGGVQQSKLGGIPNWGRSWAIKIHRLVAVYATSVFVTICACSCSHEGHLLSNVEVCRLTPLACYFIVYSKVPIQFLVICCIRTEANFTCTRRSCYQQHCTQRKMPVFNLLRGRFWGFSPSRGNTLHRWGWNLARSPPPCQISPPSVQRQGCRTPKIEIFTQIWPKSGI